MDRSRAVGWFVVLVVLMALPAIFAVSTTGQLELHARINAEHSSAADWFFKWSTHLADGVVPAVLAFLLLFFKDVRSFLMLGLSTGLSAVLTQFLKRVVYADHDRPVMFREALGEMAWVSDIDLHHHFSFPSGHSTAAFSMCLALAVIIARPMWAAAMALLAAVLGYSRVHLSQHFTEDVLLGAAIGTLTGLLVHVWLYRSSFAGKAWLNARPFQPPK